MRALAAAAVIAAAVGVTVVNVGPVAAAEAEPVSWSVAPASAAGPDGRPWVEAEGAAGDVITEYLAIRNLGASATTFSIAAADGYFTKTGRFNMLQSGEESVGAGLWISVDESITVQPGDVAVLPFTISIPSVATPGDHAAGIAASISSEGTTADGTRIGVESRVGFRVMTRVTGDLEPAFALTDLTAEYSPSWSLFAPGELTIAYTAVNEGNTQLSITDEISGETADRGDLFVGEAREVVIDDVQQWPLGLVTATVRVTSTVPTDPGVEVASVTRSVSVWAMPWLHLGALAALVFLVAIVVVRRRRRAAEIERRIEEAREQARREARAELVSS